jgi:hypothetical protein
VFGELLISGLARFPASTISNLNPIRAGRAYRQAQLIEFQRRLQDTGYFQRVEVSAELEVAATVAPANADPTQPDTALVAPVRVTVEAKLPGRTGRRLQHQYRLARPGIVRATQPVWHRGAAQVRAAAGNAQAIGAAIPRLSQYCRR